MSSSDDENRSEGSPQSTPKGVTKVVATHPKVAPSSNEITVRMRSTQVTVSGWRACAVETIAIGLGVCGVLFIAQNTGAMKTFFKGLFQSE